MDEKLYSPAQARELLVTKPKLSYTVIQWIKKGILDAHCQEYASGEKRFRISQSQIDKYNESICK